MLEIDGSTGDPLIVAQSLARRLSTPSQGLIGSPDYGSDVSALLDSATTVTALAGILANIDRQFLQDERVIRSSTTGTLKNQVLTTTSTVTTAAGPFRLTLSVSAVTIQILNVQAIT